MSTAAVTPSPVGVREAAFHRPLRVGIYTPTYPGISEGGIGTYTHHLAHGLTALGHTVHVLTPGAEEQAFTDGLVSVHTITQAYLPLIDRLVPGTGANWRVGQAMLRLVKEHALDIVELPNWEALGLYFCLRRPCPVVVRLYTSSLDSARINGGPVDRLGRWEIRREAWLTRAADALVTHSEVHGAAVANYVGVVPSTIAIVPLGIPVDLEFERPPPPQHRLSIVYLGRLERRKGTIDLLRAIPEVVKQVPEVHFTLIGADRRHCPGGRTHAEFAADELPRDVQDHISFLGELPTPEVDRWLQSADLFVAPSLYESFGLIFLEAMRWQTPVIGTRTGGIPEIIQDGVTGALVAPGSPRELAAKMVELLNDDAQRARLGLAGRRRVEEHFSVERMAQRVSRFYADTLNARRRR